jgi:gas vesicle protein
MKTYNIEGGIDFFDELYKSLDIQENDHKCDDDDNKCLITNELLTDKFVEMSCGHKFNYIALYKDLINHKQNFNSMESSNGHLKVDELRCPYCRNKHTGLLPYYEDLKLEQIHGVNYIDKNKMTYKHTPYSLKPCEYLTENVNYDASGSITMFSSVDCSVNCKFIKCMLYGKKINYPTIGDEKPYCYLHKKIILKKHIKEKQEKLKELEKQAKIKLKEEVKKAKEEAKQKEKEAKQKIKDELKTLVKEQKTVKKCKPVTNTDEGENVVMGLICIPQTGEENTKNTNKGECIEILKTGVNKGNKCGCKFYIGEYCKRHYKLPKNNNNSNEL